MKSNQAILDELGKIIVNEIIDRNYCGIEKVIFKGTLRGHRALAPGSSLDLRTYEVLKPLPAKSGKVAPWFDEVVEEPNINLQSQFKI